MTISKKRIRITVALGLLLLVLGLIGFGILSHRISMNSASAAMDPVTSGDSSASSSKAKTLQKGSLTAEALSRGDKNSHAVNSEAEFQAKKAATKLQRDGDEAKWQKRSSGKFIFHNGQSFEVLQGVAAWKEEHLPAELRHRIVDKADRYVLVDTTGRDIPMGGLLALVREEDGRVHVASGRVLVKAKVGESLNDIAEAFHCDVYEVFESLRMAVLVPEVNHVEQLSEMLSKMQKDGRVQKANLEIINTQFQKR